MFRGEGEDIIEKEHPRVHLRAHLHLNVGFVRQSAIVGNDFLTEHR